MAAFVQRNLWAFLVVFIVIYLMVCDRGVSSTVRKCIEKSTGVEFAVKIIDLTQESDNNELTEQMREETKREIDVLSVCSHHPNISQFCCKFLLFLF